MIKANELRVTNFVLNDGVVNSVIMIGYDSVELITKQGNTITARLDLIEPIKLTEEWLLKLGFERECVLVTNLHRGNLTERWVKGKFHLYNNNIDTPCYGIGLHEIWNGLMLEIKFVHSLQNLYFALTGEELNYNA